jgi:hypothetical protein
LTAQEILDQEGYVVWQSPYPLEIGTVADEPFEDGICPKGQKVHIQAEISLAEAIAWARRCGAAVTPRTGCKYFYKAIAE